MRILTAGLLAALAAATAPGPAAAQAMKVGDLGSVSSRPACMNAAQSVLSRYIDTHGGLSVTGNPASAEEWTIYGWGLRPGETDVAILCPIVANEPRAFYSIHSTGAQAAEDAATAAERIQDLWQSLR
jgi:hypothetical protein